MECKECCVEISKETYKDNDGLCYRCLKNKQKEMRKTNSTDNEKDNDEYETSILAGLYKIASIIGLIASVILLMMAIGDNVEWVLFISIASASLGCYVIGEIIQLLWNIRENLEHIRNKK